MIQEEGANDAAKRAGRGTVKAAEFEGDPGCPNSIGSSVYDTKPVRYFSMVAACANWTQKEKQKYNVDTNTQEYIKFLRLNQINKYNRNGKCIH